MDCILYFSLFEQVIDTYFANTGSLENIPIHTIHLFPAEKNTSSS